MKKTASKGGLLVGASHKEGGIDIIVPEGKIEAEGNEIILTKGVYESNEKVKGVITPDMTKREAASALNESEGGIKIAETGAKIGDISLIDYSKKLIISAGRYISKENFINTFSYESLPGKDKLKHEPHDYLNPKEIDANEYDSWFEFKHNLKPSDKIYVDSLVEKIKKGEKINPILVERLQYKDWAVLDGHHRTLAHQIAGIKIPVYYTDKELGYIWDREHKAEKGTKIENMKKYTFIEILNTKVGKDLIEQIEEIEVQLERRPSDSSLKGIKEELVAELKERYNYEWQKTASQGAKINDMKNLYYLKIGNVITEVSGNKKWQIKSHKPNGIEIAEYSALVPSDKTEFIEFPNIILNMESKLISIDGLIYENERDRYLLGHDALSIMDSFEKAEYGKKISSLKQSHDDTMAGVDALASKGKKVDGLPANMEKFLSTFPDDAVSWGQATDEIRDMARTAKEYYNEITLDISSDEDGALEALDFKELAKPSQWNTQGKKYIRSTYAKMNDQTKRQYNEWFDAQFVKKAKEGARVKNQYEGKTPERLWNDWTQEQRVHFCLDHKIPVENELLPWNDFSKNKTYVSKLAEHIEMGQYSGGGVTPADEGIAAARRDALGDLSNTLTKLTKSKGKYTAKFSYPKGGKKVVSTNSYGADIKSTRFGGKDYAKTITFEAKGKNRKEALEFAKEIASKL